MVLGESATLTLATGTWDTAIEEVPVWPSLVAVIVVIPMVPEAAVTRPFVETEASAVLADDQITGRVSTL
jgi:hypothetical protein